LNQQVLIVDVLILASAALSIPSRGLKYCKEIQIPYGKLLVPFQHGASLKRNLKIATNVADYCCICCPLDSVLLAFSGQKPILETFTFTVSLSCAYKQSARYFQSHRVNMAPFENVQKSPLKLTNVKN